MTFVSYFVDGRIRRGWLRWRQSSGSILQRLCRWQSPAGICRADPHPTAIRDGKNKRTWINFILFKVFPIFIRRSSVVIDFFKDLFLELEFFASLWRRIWKFVEILAGWYATVEQTLPEIWFAILSRFFEYFVSLYQHSQRFSRLKSFENPV